VALSFPCAPFSMQVGSLGANSRHPHPAEIKTLLLLPFRYIFRFPFVACGRVIMRGGFDDICVVVTAKTRDSRQILLLLFQLFSLFSLNIAPIPSPVTDTLQFTQSPYPLTLHFLLIALVHLLPLSLFTAILSSNAL